MASVVSLVLSLSLYTIRVDGNNYCKVEGTLLPQLGGNEKNHEKCQTIFTASLCASSEYNKKKTSASVNPYLANVENTVST